jgi:hypothetical protein
MVMTYHNVGIHHISPSQKAKLKRGCGVRLHLGSHHTMPLRADQAKKLHSAHKKGAASTVTLDPYQIDMLHGSGFFDSLKSVAKAVAPHVRPIAVNALKGVASSMLGPVGSQVAHSLIDAGSNAAAAAYGYGIKKRVGRPSKKHYVHHDVRMVEPVAHGRKLHTRGKGMFGNVLKGVSRAVRPVATNALKNLASKNLGPIGSQLAHSLIDVADQQALAAHGYGLHKKKRGRPRKHHGGALIAAGY